MPMKDSSVSDDFLIMSMKYVLLEKGAVDKKVLFEYRWENLFLFHPKSVERLAIPDQLSSF